jgi:hypothetical protein
MTMHMPLVEALLRIAFTSCDERLTIHRLGEGFRDLSAESKRAYPATLLHTSTAVICLLPLTRSDRKHASTLSQEQPSPYQQGINKAAMQSFLGDAGKGGNALNKVSQREGVDNSLFRVSIGLPPSEKRLLWSEG